MLYPFRLVLPVELIRVAIAGEDWRGTGLRLRATGPCICQSIDGRDEQGMTQSQNGSRSHPIGGNRRTAHSVLPGWRSLGHRSELTSKCRGCPLIYSVLRICYSFRYDLRFFRTVNVDIGCLVQGYS